MHRWRYSNNYPVFPSRTAPTISHNNFIGDFLDAKFLGVVIVDVVYIQENINSCVKVLRDACVFQAGVSSSSCVV